MQQFGFICGMKLVFWGIDEGLFFQSRVIYFMRNYILVFLEIQRIDVQKIKIYVVYFFRMVINLKRCLREKYEYFMELNVNLFEF